MPADGVTVVLITAVGEEQVKVCEGVIAIVGAVVLEDTVITVLAVQPLALLVATTV